MDRKEIIIKIGEEKSKLKNIDKLIKKILKIPKVQAIYLFGSTARGEENPNSDIDLCVIGELTTKEKWNVIGLGNEKIEIVFFSDLPIYVKIRVFSDGKPLFIKDEKLVSVLKLITLKQYREFSPIVQQRLRRMFEYV